MEHSTNVKVPAPFSRLHLRRGPPLRLRFGLWGARLAMLVLFAAFTLALTASFIYAANDAILPEDRAAIGAAAHNRCVERYALGSRPYRSCLYREPPAPSQDAWPFVRSSALVAGAGLLLTVVAVRGRVAILIPALVLAGVTAVGTMEVRRGIVDEREHIARLRAPPATPEPAESPR